MNIARGIRAIAAETGVDSRFVALLAREGYAQIIWSLVMVEQRRRRNIAENPEPARPSKPE